MSSTQEALEVQQPGPIAQSTSVESMLMLAIDKGVSIETLERLMVMRRELMEESARNAFFSALARFQSDCPTITKDDGVIGNNGKLRYRYASLDKIVEIAKPHLRNHGLSYTINVKFGDNGSYLTAYVFAHHEAGHTEVSEFEVPVANDNFMNAAQHAGSASTYAKRYAFCNAFGILTGDGDDDANSTTPDEPKQSRPMPSGTKPPQQAAKPDIKREAPPKAPTVVRKTSEKAEGWQHANRPVGVSQEEWGDEDHRVSLLLQIEQACKDLDYPPAKMKETLARAEVLPLEKIKDGVRELQGRIHTAEVKAKVDAVMAEFARLKWPQKDIDNYLHKFGTTLPTATLDTLVAIHDDLGLA